MISRQAELAGVRRDVEASTRAQLRRGGLRGLQRRPIVDYAAAHGASPRAAYRWIAAVVAERSTEIPSLSMTPEACQAAVEAVLRDHLPGIAAAVVGQLCARDGLGETRG